MTLSILHRATGAALSVGLIALAAWLLCAASGPEQYARFVALCASWAGQIALIGWSFSFFFHLMNGVRHLFWDTGRGLEKHQATLSAYFVIISAVVLSAGFWLVLL